MGEYVADFLRAPRRGRRRSITSRSAGPTSSLRSHRTKPHAHLAFAPHLDTVSVAGMTIPPFDPVIRDGKLFGRGSSDTKGPMAAALWAVREWAQSPARAHSRIHWTFLGADGRGGGQRRRACRWPKRASPATSPSCWSRPSSASSRRTRARSGWKSTTTGVACHGSTPEQGRNAIYAMRRVLEVIEEKIIPGLSRHAHPKLGPTTLNVGTISGGSKINIVPDQCRIEIDCRVVPGVDAEKFRSELEVGTARRRARRHRAHRSAIRRRSTPTNRCPGCSGSAQPRAASPPRRGFPTPRCSSGPHCPAVCIGPGSIAQAHTKDEFILLRDLEEGAEFFRRWMHAAEDFSHES